jgi:transposase
MAEKQTRRRFTAEFKAQAVKRLLESGKGLSEVATELGLSPGQLSAWCGDAARCRRPDARPGAAGRGDLTRRQGGGPGVRSQRWRRDGNGSLGDHGPFGGSTPPPTERVRDGWAARRTGMTGTQGQGEG